MRSELRGVRHLNFYGLKRSTQVGVPSHENKTIPKYGVSAPLQARKCWIPQGHVLHVWL